MDESASMKDALATAGLDRLASRLLDLCRPAIRLVPRPAPGDLEPGATKIGGLPDLRSAGDWPRCNGTRLAFLAQVNLADLKPFEFCSVLPCEGVLQFFYDDAQTTWGFDPNDRGSFAVRYEPSAADLRSADGAATFAECDVELREICTLPAWGSPDLDALDFTAEERRRYLLLIDRVGDALVEGGPAHQLLGNAAPIQGDMQLDCQLVSNGLYCGDPSGYRDPRAEALRPGAHAWRLLLQLDSDADAGMTWGDLGRVYFWVTEEALRGRDFSSAWMILQCY
jgi:uncharacterized protein YwqG